MITDENRDQLAAAFLRGLTLASRFGLMFYLATELSLSQMGLFGLYWAGLQLSASLIPLDAYAQTTRLLLSENANTTLTQIIGLHFGFVIFSIVALTPIAVYLNVTFGAELNSWLLLLFLCHLPLEVLATEVGRLLVPLGRPFIANVILFLRSALWFFPITIVFYLNLVPKSVEYVVFAWVIGSLAAAGLGLFIIRKNLSGKMRISFDPCWVKELISGSLVFFFATLLFKLLLGVDRYIVDSFYGQDIVGVYTIYASVSLGVLALVESGVSSWHYPRLVVAVRSNGTGTKKIVQQFFIQNGIASLILMAGIVIIFPVAVKLFLSEDYYRYINTFYVMALGVFIYCLSMPFHYVVYASGRDWDLVFIYIISMFCMVIWVAFFMLSFGVEGAGAMLSISLVTIAILRFIFAFRQLRLM